MLAGGTPILATLTAGYFIIKKPGTTLKFLVKTPYLLPHMTYKSSIWATRQLRGKYLGPAGSLRRMFFSGAQGPQKMLMALKNGNLTLEKATAIVQGSQKGGLFHKVLEKENKLLYNALSAHNPDMLKRGLVKSLFAPHTSLPDADANLLVKYFDTKAINARITGQSAEDVVSVLGDLKGIENLQLAGNQHALLMQILQKNHFSGVDMQALAERIKHADLSTLTAKEIKQLAKSFRKANKEGKLLAQQSDFDTFINNAKLGSNPQRLPSLDESIRRNPKYQALDDAFDREIKLLDADYQRLKTSGAKPAKLDQVKKQLDSFTEFKKTFALGKTQSEIDALYDGYKTMAHFVPDQVLKHLNSLSQLLKHADIDQTELEQALKRLNLKYFADLKGKKLQGLSDETIDVMIDFLKAVRSKRVIAFSDTTLQAMKSFAKVIGKIT
ncbi:MAG: hypothetical protein Q4B28_02660 [bacterium]|nr:hypothetical protein [bacterium]